MKFVLHEHKTDNRHFDLMIETGEDLLLTWRIMPSDLDMLLAGNEIKGIRIQDHDKIFLEYEGSLSSGNGSVMRFDQGTSEMLKKRNKTFTVILTGRILKGKLHLSGSKKNIFNIQYFPGHTKQ